MTIDSTRNHPMDEVLEYYGAGVELQRLKQGIGQIELARTQEILTRYLPPSPAVVYDVGGGTGVYSFWLAQQGYEVHLFELTPQNVAIARMTSAGANDRRLASLTVADGRCLERPDCCADVVLLMGPLYHLTEREERIKALKEAWRVLRPGGLIMAAAISRYSSALFGLSTFGPNGGAGTDLLNEPEFVEMMMQELEDGQHIRPARYHELIARSFFHLPEELKDEVTEGGFAEAEVLAVEGPGWIVPEFEDVWRNPRKREAILRVARKVEKDPAILGLSPHLLAAARKPLS